MEILQFIHFISFIFLGMCSGIWIWSIKHVDIDVTVASSLAITTVSLSEWEQLR